MRSSKSWEESKGCCLSSYRLCLPPLLWHRAVLHIVDTDPTSLSANGWLEDTSKVEKYVMSEDDYNKRDNTYRCACGCSLPHAVSVIALVVRLFHAAAFSWKCSFVMLLEQACLCSSRTQHLLSA